MTAILEIPEVAGLDARRSLVRIPPEFDVPLTGRVRHLIDIARSSAGWRGSANWDWFRWSIRPRSIRGSSTRWASTAWPCCC